MTQEDKAQLLKDLSARLPYAVKAYVKNWSNFKTYEDVYVVKSTFPSLNEVHVQSETGSLDVLIGYYDYDIKPYLFPMSSMTDEQKKEFIEISGCEIQLNEQYGFNSCGNYVVTIGDYEYDYDEGINIDNFYPNFEIFDWLNKNHFDYRGLIEKGLALDATNENIY